MPTLTQLLLASCVLGCLLAFAAPEAPKATPFDKGEVKIEMSLKYLVALPDGYADDKTNGKEGGRGWPLILFLHGVGERGTDVNVVGNVGLPRLVRDGKKLPAVFVAPQCPPDQWWDAQTLKVLVDQVVKEYGCDPDRLYITGLSMGGFGTWEMINRYPNLFAAAAPVCGGGDVANVLQRKTLKTLPIWAFHGEDDEIVPVARTKEMVEAVKKLGNENVKMTLYPGVKHPSWDQAYREPELFEWMLKQKRAAAEKK